MPLLETKNFTKEYVLNGLPNRAVQKTYIDFAAKKIYALQLNVEDPTKEVRLSCGDLPSSSTEVDMTQYSPMILKGFGHGETLEKANNPHESGDWFWITTGATGTIKYPSFAQKGLYWGRQIGLIKFVAGTTVDYKDIKRISAVSYLTETQKSYGTLLRVDAALSSTTGRLIIMGESESGTHYLSCYNEQAVINGFYSSSTNTLEGNKSPIFKKGAGKGYVSAYPFTHKPPYGSQQGLEFNDSNKVYISGGQIKQYPHVLKGDWRFTAGNYQTVQLNVSKEELPDVETEGIQLHGANVYIGLEFHNKNAEPHRIYSFPKNTFTV
ncbi:hypothetical protein G8J22_02444 [Lentilactobacillus hilgardii]|uniref:helveticin J family class III bacteriocin n=1 Tax=Lentilactobacillus hilgardii TaxID=1588 RepID=UPI00019C5AF9|nr:helveticin J family class III bacteriocin [Lentilactobacillus hilgardii]EEI19724.1 hypothetical protein HMPREF0497_1561 [Lentilactobacillus buchneri ATCC 11577]MCT3396627.1 hypothetical protein [Lentilactobacillus hilgardii]QIR10436.1 hypothetical protein G8J22_02444 [Lentilactobacillus hilgardii]